MSQILKNANLFYEVARTLQFKMKIFNQSLTKITFLFRPYSYENHPKAFKDRFLSDLKPIFNLLMGLFSFKALYFILKYFQMLPS
jgi:hypothetical protein